MNRIRMKHMGSSAADLEIDYQIDTANRMVSLQASAFDSALITDFGHRAVLAEFFCRAGGEVSHGLRQIIEI